MRGGGTVGIYVQMKTKAPCYDPKRKFTCTTGRQAGDPQRLSDAFFRPTRLASATSSGQDDLGHHQGHNGPGQVQGSKSKDFEVTRFRTGG